MLMNISPKTMDRRYARRLKFQYQSSSSAPSTPCKSPSSSISSSNPSLSTPATPFVLQTLHLSPPASPTPTTPMAKSPLSPLSPPSFCSSASSFYGTPSTASSSTPSSSFCETPLTASSTPPSESFSAADGSADDTKHSASKASSPEVKRRKKRQARSPNDSSDSEFDCNFNDLSFPSPSQLFISPSVQKGRPGKENVTPHRSRDDVLVPALLQDQTPPMRPDTDLSSPQQPTQRSTKPRTAFANRRPSPWKMRKLSGSPVKRRYQVPLSQQSVRNILNKPTLESSAPSTVPILSPVKHSRSPFTPLAYRKKSTEPFKSPCDRFIPSRKDSNLTFDLNNSQLPFQQVNTSYLSIRDTEHGPSYTNCSPEISAMTKGLSQPSRLYSLLLRAEILGDPAAHEDLRSTRHFESGQSSSSSSTPGSKSPKYSRTLRFQPPMTSSLRQSPYKRLPIASIAESGLASSPSKPKSISTTPFRVLDAPGLGDDFYLNLLDWGASNFLAVGLSRRLFLWSSKTCEVQKLAEYSSSTITSVKWSPQGTHLAVGKTEGDVLVYDVSFQNVTWSVRPDNLRVGTLAWNAIQQSLSLGTRRGAIQTFDMRTREMVQEYKGHRHEVCGLCWSNDGTQLASGGNDNQVFVWDVRSSKPLTRFAGHDAAVKAIAWSPHQTGLLATGGGTADRTVRLWNTVSQRCTKIVDTGSQVCNLVWSSCSNEFVTSHGYSLNQLVVWKYPQLKPVATLTGHSFRVLYLTKSPDSSTVVTGAGDETLRFWHVFGSSGKQGRSSCATKEAGIVPEWTSIR